MDRKVAQVFPELAIALKNRVPEPIVKNKLDLETIREIEELKLIHNNFAKTINFDIYKEFFRLFCYDKYVEFEYFLRADYKSFN